MRYRNLLVFAVTILGLPQTALSVDGWANQSIYTDDSKGRYAFDSYRSPAPINRHAPVRGYQSRADYLYPSPSHENYRFRAWDRGRMSPQSGNNRMPRMAPDKSVSYWGGIPVNRVRPVVSVKREQESTQYRDVQQSRIRSTYHQPDVSGYSPGQYRFRPLHRVKAPESHGRLKYRPMQVHIPDQARFRPLNPVARTKPYPVRTAQYRRDLPRPYSTAGYWPRYDIYPQPAPTGRYVYSYPAGRHWPGFNPRREPWQQHMAPAQSVMSGYARRDSSQVRFRPQPTPRNTAFQPGRLPRFAQRRFTQPPNWSKNRPRGYHLYPYPAPTTVARQWPPAPMGYRPQWQPPVTAQQRTDWYDGRGDGEGAWYQLTSRSMPVVTQRWSDADTEFAGGY
ncbi:MAG: hypothetical protein KZQ93_16845 [Candidatus Thiodiazotropha sp. (ex Monitilora ramsayi)]|nr:hypothetical protein [Candidatus Thiodiazotropha sp. (ex Monitilora ramsayi)]